MSQAIPAFPCRIKGCGVAGMSAVAMFHVSRRNPTRYSGEHLAGAGVRGGRRPDSRGAGIPETRGEASKTWPPCYPLPGFFAGATL